jgi:ketosteroid isomerase-like protein
MRILLITRDYTFRIRLVVMCVVLVGLKANAQTFDQTLHVHLKALRTGDIVAFEPTVANDIIHISPMGEKNTSREQFMKLHQEWFKRTNWEWEGVIVKKHNNRSLGYALIELTYKENDANGDINFSIKCYLTLIFKKSVKGWQLVYDQNTVIPE